MIKNNFTMPATYVSPAVKVTKLNPRRVMCTSPYGEQGAAGAQGLYVDETQGDENDY